MSFSLLINCRIGCKNTRSLINFQQAKIPQRVLICWYWPLSIRWLWQAIPGLYITPKLNLQTIVGLSIGHLKYYSFGTRNNFLNIYYEPGFVVGGGIDYRLSSFLHAGLIYEYTKYHRKNNVSGNEGFYIRNGSTDTNRVMLTLSYFFGSS